MPPYNHIQQQSQPKFGFPQNGRTIIQFCNKSGFIAAFSRLLLPGWHKLSEKNDGFGQSKNISPRWEISSMTRKLALQLKKKFCKFPSLYGFLSLLWTFVILLNNTLAFVNYSLDLGLVTNSRYGEALLLLGGQSQNILGGNHADSIFENIKFLRMN